MPTRMARILDGTGGSENFDCAIGEPSACVGTKSRSRSAGITTSSMNSLQRGVYPAGCAGCLGVLILRPDRFTIRAIRQKQPSFDVLAEPGRSRARHADDAARHDSESTAPSSRRSLDRRRVIDILGRMPAEFVQPGGRPPSPQRFNALLGGAASLSRPIFLRLSRQSCVPPRSDRRRRETVRPSTHRSRVAGRA